MFYALRGPAYGVRVLDGKKVFFPGRRKKPVQNQWKNDVIHWFPPLTWVTIFTRLGPLKYNTAHLAWVGPHKELTCINLHNIMNGSCPPVFLSHFAWSAQINKTPPLSTQSYSCHPTIGLRHTKTCLKSFVIGHVPYWNPILFRN